MAAAPLKADTAKMSFARVAASAGKENVALASFAKVAATIPSRDVRKQEPSSSLSPNQSMMNERRSHNGEAEPRPSSKVDTEQAIVESKLVDAVKALYVQDSKGALVVNGSGSAKSEGKSTSPSVSPDDPYQRADSSSDLGTKPPSLDGKSITSGTTFALDEKESLRPDDSASVKAAAEDDDTFSGRGSIVAGSRMGSEAAARAYRSQFYENADRRAIASHEPNSHGIVTPQSHSSTQQVLDDGKPQTIIDERGGDAFSLFYSKNPDEKLIEALQSPKDRIFLLRIEQDVIEFVKHSKEPFIDLPPCNSFCRMLTHKLADYYHLTHQVDAVAGAVRIFRTPFCRLPESLASLSSPSSSANTPPPPVPAMKIMRRDGGTGPSPSKATSESGSDSKDKSGILGQKEKLSREDREAAYLKARERIFGNSEKNSEIADGESGNEMSRSSSMSTKDKTGAGKRNKPGKQRRDDTDGFDVRSQYTPYFPPQQQQPPSWGMNPQYSPLQMQQRFNNGIQPVYHPAASPPYGTPPQQYNQGLMGRGVPQYTPMTQFPQSSPQPPFQNPGPPSIPVYGPPGTPPSQQWAQNVFQSPYQGRPPTMNVPNTVPYAYGKLPAHSNPADPKSQHPIPGSYNRHAFNPATQSFVPGNGSPLQQPMIPHGSPHLPYNVYPSPAQQFSNGMGYGMMQQGPNASAPPFHGPQLTNRPPGHQGLPSIGPAGAHLPNYGNAVSLPPKPPTR